MHLRKLSSTDAFVVIDLEGSEQAVGIVRLAKKILRDGAELLARSTTYQLASFEWRASGASGGINATPDQRTDAVEAFVAELRAADEGPQLLLDAGKGLTDDDLASLLVDDPRPHVHHAWRHRLTGLSAAVAAETARGGLDGVRVAIERLDPVSTALLAEVTARGAVVVAAGLPDGSGTVQAEAGLEAGALVAAAEGDADALASLPPASEVAVTGVPADIVAVGSRAGVIDHEVAAALPATLVLPVGPVPVTARGLAVARRAGCTVLPDFLTTAGASFALWADAEADADDVGALVGARVRDAVVEVLPHPEGPLLGACERAEAFLRTWQDDLPFGRPIA